MPRSEACVLIGTIAVFAVTRNLAVGVSVGVLTAMALFARRLARVLRVHRSVDVDGSIARYGIVVPLFFGSRNDLAEQFFYDEDAIRVVIQLKESQIWAATSVAVLDAIQVKYVARGGHRGD